MITWLLTLWILTLVIITYLDSVFEATFLYENGFTQFHTPSTLRKAGPSSPIYLFAPQLLSFVPVRIGYNH